MSVNVIMPDGSTGTRSYLIRAEPDTCPTCQMSGQMKQMAGFALKKFATGADIYQMVYRCQRLQCATMFFGDFTVQTIANSHYLVLQQVYPKTPTKNAIPTTVAEISPAFVELYTQAVAADQVGLGAIYGVGLRKALELLIKDYCINMNPADSLSIKQKFLGNVIKEHVNNSNIKACAERAAWLGNDETHYERRWVGQDVNDLHVLIQLTMSWIHDEAVTAKYLAVMP